jgi:hypothetical protein
MALAARLGRILIMTCIGTASCSFPAKVKTTASAQGLGPLSDQYSPGAIPSALRLMFRRAVTGQPFQAKLNVRFIRKMPNGTWGTFESHLVLARDAAGRLYQKQLPSPRKADAGYVARYVIITDPAAGVEIQWSAEAKSVLKYPLPAPSRCRKLRQPDWCERESGRVRQYPNGGSERIRYLGQRTTLGILTNGCRVSIFFPADTAHYQAAHIRTVESWLSPGLPLPVLSLVHDPGGVGEETWELNHVVRGEPNIAAFEPPSNFKIHNAAR